MLIVGSLLSPAGVESKTRADAGISFICKWDLITERPMSDAQSCSWSAFHSASRPSSKISRHVDTHLTYRGLYPAEVLSFENRSKGLSLQGWCSNALTTINTFGLPPALGALGYIGQYTALFFAQADRQCTTSSLRGISSALPSSGSSLLKRSSCLWRRWMRSSRRGGLNSEALSSRNLPGKGSRRKRKLDDRCKEGPYRRGEGSFIRMRQLEPREMYN